MHLKEFSLKVQNFKWRVLLQSTFVSYRAGCNWYFSRLKVLHCQGRLWKQGNVEEYRASFEFRTCTLNEIYLRLQSSYLSSTEFCCELYSGIWSATRTERFAWPREAGEIVEFRGIQSYFFKFSEIYCKDVYEMNFIQGFQEGLSLWAPRQAFTLCTGAPWKGLRLIL